MAVLCLSASTACFRQTDPAKVFDSATKLFQQGEYAAAQQKAVLGQREFQSQPQSEWFWKFTLLLAEVDYWNGDTNQANQRLAKEPPAKYRQCLLRYRILRSYGLYRGKKVAEADRELELAAAQAHAIGDWGLEADAEILLGSRLLPATSVNREAALRNALQVATEHGLAYQKTQALLDLGMTRYKRDLYGDAIPYFEQAAGLARRMDFKASHRMAIQNAADCYREMGDVDRTLKIQMEVVAGEEKTGAPTTLSNAYIDLGQSYVLKHDNARAIEYFRKAVKCVRASDVSSQFVLSASNLAGALERVGALDEAEKYNNQALQACDKQNKERLAELTLNKAAIAEDRNEHEKAIQAYGEAIEQSQGTPSVLWEAHAGLGAVYAGIGGVSDARTHFEEALRVIEQNRADQIKRDYEVMFLSSLIHFYQEYVAVLLSQGDGERAIEVADSSRASVLTEGVNGSGTVRSGRLVSDVQRMAKLARTVFLFYWLAPRRSYLWVMTPQDVKTIELPGEHAIAQDVASYLSMLVNEKRDPLAASSAMASRLYRTLIEPAETWLPRGTSVIIIPDGALHNLNFEMLVAEKPRPHYWIQDVTISIAPSLSILSGGRSARTAKLQPMLLLMGDPEPAAGYPKLPHAGLEIENVEHHFAGNQSVFRGADATVDRYREAEPRKFSNIHFAAHAEANQHSPLDSAIILSPQQSGYKLYARDVIDIPLTADLVTISACRGAGTQPFSGEGLVGFAWAFFQAGARNVVTSLWDVNDQTTAELMNVFYDRIESGESYANALRDAKLAMLESRNRKPYYWAPFQLHTRVTARN